LAAHRTSRASGSTSGWSGIAGGGNRRLIVFQPVRTEEC
jgi:hypothetical protein